MSDEKVNRERQDNYKEKFAMTCRDLIWIIIILFLIIIALCALLIVDKHNAANILSVVSTGISIVLSVVAIIYTFIAGAQSSNLNTETQMQILKLENQIKLLNEGIKRKEALQEEIAKYTKEVQPFVEEVAQSKGESIKIDPDMRERASRLREIIKEDIENDE